MKTTTYKGVGHRGVLGDLTAEYWTDEDWVKHYAHVEELKKNGIYGQPFEFTATLVDNPLYDSPTYNKGSITSARFEILDFGKTI